MSTLRQLLSAGLFLAWTSPYAFGAPNSSATFQRVSLQESNAIWSFVAPEGPFFSMGVCMVSQGANPQTFDPENPSYAAWRYYSNSVAWADATLERLKSWGFTTIGAWSDHDQLRRAQSFRPWLTPILHMGATAGAPWWDMWDPKVTQRMEETAREQILPLREDPRVLGYYSDNEMGWWNATLWKTTLEQPATSGQRQRLMQLLHETYTNDWQGLLADFEPEKASNWNELESAGMLWLKPGGRGIHVMRRFLGQLADRYYQLVHDLIRKYDPHALILGDRYQSFYYPEVAQAAARWVDALSSNLNASWNDGTYLRYHLDTLHSLSRKPVLVSEIYLAAQENRSGNRNSYGVFPVVTSQGQRAQAIRTTLLALARTPYVVGVDWFQYFDEPKYGRYDGENFNFGLVDTQNQPYPEVTSVFAALDPQKIHTQTGPPPADASDGIPPAPPDPLANFTATRALKDWDREHGFVKPSTSNAIADLYVCWSPQALYLGLYGLDAVEDAYYRSHAVPKGERARWEIVVDQAPALSVRLGAGRDAIPSDADIRVVHLPGLNQNVYNVAALELPAVKVGRKSLHAGDVVELAATLSTHAQAYQVQWKGTFRLRDAL